jgi:hypothetical protein
MQVTGKVVERRAGPDHRVVLALQVERVDVAPTMLETDAHAHVDEDDVLIHRVLQDRAENRVTREGDGQDEKPSDREEHQVSVPGGEAQRPLYFNFRV